MSGRWHMHFDRISCCILLICLQFICYGSLDEEDGRLSAGKAKYEAMKKDAKMPKYGPCWTEALLKLDVGCKELTDDVQHHLALGFTNCFLLKTGRGHYPCEDHQAISKCMKDMSSEAYNAYTDFFTHTQNICFFLQSQVWQEQTESTISRLRDSSDVVAQQMEDSSHIQSELIKQQNRSIENQQMLLDHGSKLRDTIRESKVDVNKMLLEFKSSTSEQKQLIFEVFDRVNLLQNLVMGEFTGFYSLIFYAVSILICYLLTSTPRTSGARFWLFVLMTVNMVMERTLVMWGAHQNIDNSGHIIDENTIIYNRLSACRKVFAAFAVFIWSWCAYAYRDINAVNNKLLLDIQKQNSELKHLLQGNENTEIRTVVHRQAIDRRAVNQRAIDLASEIDGASPRRIGNGSSVLPSTSTTQVAKVLDTTDALLPDLNDSKYSVSLVGSTADYDSDSDFESDDSSLNSAMTDRTFTADTFHDDGSSDTSAASSFFTASFRSRGGRESTPMRWEEEHVRAELRDELRDLRDCTPMREMTPIPGLTIADMSHDRRVSPNGFVSSASSLISPRRGVGHPRGSTRRSAPAVLAQQPDPSPPRYNLRSRKGRAPTSENPVVKTETAANFAKTVKHLAQVATRNRVKAMATLRSTGQSSNGQLVAGQSSSRGQGGQGQTSEVGHLTRKPLGFFSSDEDV